MDNKRLFIALNIPELIREQLEKILALIKIKEKSVKWCASNGMHLTLHFLGDINAGHEKKVILALQPFTGKFGGLEMKLGKIGAFPNLASPRVIYIECLQTNGSAIFDLQSSLAEKLEKLGINIDRRAWQPHLTLGRVRKNETYKIPDELAFPNKKFSITSFELMSSELKPNGAEYNIEISYKL